MNISEARHEAREKELERWAEENELVIEKENGVYRVTDSEGFLLDDDGETEFDFVSLYRFASGK